jgi:8-oxo-dGTP pyrophosphatase MutT (NUDIX family)
MSDHRQVLPKISRSCARIICLDPEGRILLLRWRDPLSGRMKWEPPGGGMESGETPFQAARRELVEETGLPPDLIEPASIEIDRQYQWNGREVEGREWYYVAHLSSGDVDATGMLASETEQFLGYRWLEPQELKALGDAVEPPQLNDIVEQLAKPRGVHR